jgi:hypothetical protein
MKTLSKITFVISLLLFLLSPRPAAAYYDPGSGSLQHGSASGKAGNTASDADIKDCITKVPPSKDYSKFGYSCKSWAKEAAAKWGLDCN